MPRHIFVDEALASRAYEDTALPIGFGQTISQPYIVARMTEALLEGGPLAKVLEIGTGCGYQTAVLAPLVGRIYTIERIEALQKRARERLRSCEIRNVRFRHGDGAQGWKTQAPFDGILVAAAPLTDPRGAAGTARRWRASDRAGGPGGRAAAGATDATRAGHRAARARCGVVRAAGGRARLRRGSVPWRGLF